MTQSLPHALRGWLDRRMDEMLSAPRMWGSDESIELQILLLLELKSFVRHPSSLNNDPRRVIDAYLGFLRDRFPSRPNMPLHQLLSAEPQQFSAVLSEFRALLDSLVLDENPFEHSELAIELRFSEERRPNATALTGYYEEFRRATRAIVGGKQGGRPTKNVESATDFSIDDVRVTPRNGKPASALLLLGLPNNQQDFDTHKLVREGLAGLATMVEWAASTAELNTLAMDDVETRTRTAVQALRVMPRRGVEKVSLGGKLMGRAKPIVLAPAQQSRLVEVASAGTTPISFDRTDEVRAVDLDRGFIRLGKSPRVVCYVQQDELVKVTEVGVRARVLGDLYKPPSGAAFVLVRGLDVV